MCLIRAELLSLVLDRFDDEGLLGMGRLAGESLGCSLEYSLDLPTTRGSGFDCGRGEDGFRRLGA